MTIYQYAIQCVAKQAEENLKRPDLPQDERRRDLRIVEIWKNLDARLQRKAEYDRTAKAGDGARAHWGL
jgi:hypothetical protein